MKRFSIVISMISFEKITGGSLYPFWPNRKGLAKGEYQLEFEKKPKDGEILTVVFSPAMNEKDIPIKVLCEKKKKGWRFTKTQGKNGLNTVIFFAGEGEGFNTIAPNLPKEK